MSASVPELSRPSIFTIPFGADLCDQTARLVMEQAGTGPLKLANAVILLPNNRAIRAMTESFVRQAAPGLLMPRLVAIGDLALEESIGPLLDPIDANSAIPRPIPPLQRQLLLAELVRKHRGATGTPVDATEAMRLARLLSELIDELEVEQVDIARLAQLRDEESLAASSDLAAHWQASYAGLLHILPEYQDRLAEMEMAGPAACRNLLLARFEQRLSAIAPDFPVIASGISTAAPAIARLLSRIAKLPQGQVVLPPLDLQMPEDDWQALDPSSESDEAFPRFGRETHPQFHLKLLIERMGIHRAEIELLGAPAQSHQAIANVFCLPEASVGWSGLADKAKKLPHVRVLEAEDSAEEARAIAILVREALEQPQKRIAIVTPDRELAMRIGQQLKRWNINVDDSAGQPILQTPPGKLLMALVEAIAAHFSPLTLLAIAKHPLVMKEDNRHDWLQMARALDLELRGPASGLGLEAITRLLGEKLAAANNSNSGEKKRHFQTLASWWHGFAAMLRPVDKSAHGEFALLLEVLARVAGELTRGEIWKGPAGRQMASLFEEFAQVDFAQAGKVARESLPEFFAEICKNTVLRPPYGGHPRVALLGLLEARLQKADLMICAGLNEGSWPQLPQPDPWLAPRIRRELGLAALERNIGLSAHDLANAMGAQECIISRAKRDRSGPTVSSRFLLRIAAFLGTCLGQEERALAFARKIDAGDPQPHALPPIVEPDARQRMVELSVTDFDKLLADPFAFYAGKILRVRPLDDVEEEADARWRGTLIHDVLEKWAKEDDCQPEKLMKRAAEMLDNAEMHPNIRVLWQPRITAALQWIAEETSDLFGAGRSLAGAEVGGETELAGVKVKGRADRIDRMPDGSLAIIDYKTGKPPEPKQIRAGFALQLGLLGRMAESGAFEGISGKASTFEYWSLAKDDGEFGKRKSAAGGRGDSAIAADELITFMQGKAISAVERWITGSAAFEAKLHPEFAPFAEFDQLSRLQEWDGRQSTIEDVTG